MKKINTLLFAFLFSLTLIAQQAPPQGINYQAVVYTSTGNQQPGVNSSGQQLLNNGPVKVTFHITAGNQGPEVFREEHDGITTDQYGLVNLVIGQGNQVSSNAFNQIDWSYGDMFLGVEIYVYENLPVQEDTIYSYQKLWSVPYALYAGQATSASYADSSDYAENSGYADTADYANLAGNGFTGVTDNGNGTLTFTYLNGSTFTTPVLSGLIGAPGPQGPAGQNGQSAYELWLSQGNVGTQQDFINSLQGAIGPAGPSGIPGTAGPQGPSGAQGAAGPAGAQGIAGTNGKNTLVKTTTELAGINCASGGVKIEYGLDANSNGTLDVTEINATLTKYVCNGAVGATGPQGPIGLTGATGPQGIPGSQNAWSLTGNTGTSSTTNFIGTTDAQDWVVKSNNTERLRVTSSGNIGIWTQNPSARLSISYPDTGLDPFSLCDDTDFKRFKLDIEGASDTLFTNVRFDVFPKDNTSQAQFRFFRETNTTGSKTVRFYRGNNTATSSAIIGVDGENSFFQLHGGNLGIGTSTPNETFHVNGIARIENFIKINGGSGASGYTHIRFQDLLSSGGLDKFTMGLTDGGTGNFNYFITRYDDTGAAITTALFINRLNGFTGIATSSPDQLLSVNGNASKIGGGSWATFSDKRVKQDIKPFRDGLDVLMQLKPVTYRYNEKSGYTDLNKSFVGFIAQEVENVAPYMVNLYDDSEGPSGLKDKRQFDESALNKILVNAVQEQQAQIELLKQEMEEMKVLIKELSKK
jgi:hypothetical protein